MNRNRETRIECTDWDEEVPVATWAMGRGRMPARKVITRGVAKVELTARQAGSIVGKLAAGMEVRLAMGGEEAIRFSPVRGGVLPCGGRRLCSRERAGYGRMAARRGNRPTTDLHDSG